MKKNANGKKDKRKKRCIFKKDVSLKKMPKKKRRLMDFFLKVKCQWLKNWT